ncbi:hypothetical protein [Micromonospora sp. LOL_023]|uniref:hypothetical protein n=1 Tax=Micromonospora sp. LOL_023 TaxID=3345418 RepID=UPI003A8868FC
MQEDVLYVHDGPVSTSAGIAAGIDLALSIVERHPGPLRYRDHLHPGGGRHRRRCGMVEPTSRRAMSASRASP